jgi:hypothetical protein
MPLQATRSPARRQRWRRRTLMTLSCGGGGGGWGKRGKGEQEWTTAVDLDEGPACSSRQGVGLLGRVKRGSGVNSGRPAPFPQRPGPLVSFHTSTPPMGVSSTAILASGMRCWLAAIAAWEGGRGDGANGRDERVARGFQGYGSAAGAQTATRRTSIRQAPSCAAPPHAPAPVLPLPGCAAQSLRSRHASRRPPPAHVHAPP